MLGQINLTKTNIRAINFVNELEIEKKTQFKRCFGYIFRIL